MKKLIYILVAISAFIFGVTAFYLRPVVKPAPLSEVVKNVELYKWQRVYIKGYLDVRRLKSENLDFYSVFDFKKGCLKDCIEGASLQLPNNFQNNTSISGLINELGEKNEQTNSLDDGSYYAEVEIVGTIEKINACFAPPYIIKADKIKQISSIKFLSKAELDEIIGVNKSAE